MSSRRKATGNMFSFTNYRYDAAGQFVERASCFADAEAPDHTVKSEYDRLVKVTYDDNRTEEYLRDTWGKVLKITATDGEGGPVRESVMKYDYFDRLVEQVETVDGKLAVSNQYAYNAYGQRTLRETVTPLGPQTETREYDECCFGASGRRTVGMIDDLLTMMGAGVDINDAIDDMLKELNVYE